MNTSGTTGYPHVRYGRGSFGRVRRSTKSAQPAATLKRMDANITYVKSCSYVPDSARSADHAVSQTIARCGVRYRGCTRLAAGRNTPSDAMANSSREPARIAGTVLPNVETSTV